MTAKQHAGEHHSPLKHIVGYVLSLVLTVIAFWIALSLHMKDWMTLTIILVLAVFQLLVQLLMFMHLNEADSQVTVVLQKVAIFFGIFIAICVAGGSIWIMAFKSIVA